ncbi:MAG: ATP-binding cassette domain-containing protein [Acidimicrobiia bacterium]
MNHQPVLELSAIEKRFGPITALSGVDLTLHPGEVLGVVGDNGAGKSTLMKVISGAYIADAGTYRLDGREVHFRSPADARNERLEMVYQDLSLCDTIDVAQNLFLGREPVKRMLGLPFLDHHRLHAQAAEVLARLQIKVPSTYVKVRNLSGGQRQAIAIGRSVAYDPKVLILDEPTAALAVKEVEEVLALIRRLKSEGVGVILISHRLQDVLEVTDRIMFMYEGRKVAERATPETNLEEVIKLIVQA